MVSLLPQLLSAVHTMASRRRPSARHSRSASERPLPGVQATDDYDPDDPVEILRVERLSMSFGEGWPSVLVRPLFPLVVPMRPQQDSNLRTRLRRAVLYPLSYGGWRDRPASAVPAGPEQGYQQQVSTDTRPICTHHPCEAG
jgi:hypothetical protein